MKPKAGFELDLTTFAGEQLYDLRRDPQENTPIATGVDPATLKAFSDQIAWYLEICETRRQGLPVEPAPLPAPEEEQRLRALGYAD